MNGDIAAFTWYLPEGRSRSLDDSRMQLVLLLQTFAQSHPVVTHFEAEYRQLKDPLPMLVPFCLD